MAPSAVQKERLEPDDLFILKADGSIMQSPAAEKNLKLSQCTPLFMNAFTGELLIIFQPIVHGIMLLTEK